MGQICTRNYEVCAEHSARGKAKAWRERCSRHRRGAIIDSEVSIRKGREDLKFAFDIGELKVALSQIPIVCGREEWLTL